MTRFGLFITSSLAMNFTCVLSRYYGAESQPRLIAIFDTMNYCTSRFGFYVFALTPNVSAAQILVNSNIYLAHSQ